MIRAFIVKEPFQLVAHEDPATRDLIYRVAIDEQPPMEWATVLGDAVHNLRSALDLMAVALVAENSGPQAVTRKTAYPVSDDERTFKRSGIRLLDGASDRALRLTRLLKPYAGGCDTLWELHVLDIDDKHKLLVPVGAALRGFTPQFKVEGFPDDLFKKFNETIVIEPANNLFPLRDGDVVFKVAAAARDSSTIPSHKIHFDVAFADGTGRAVEGEQVLQTLDRYALLVDRVIGVYERHGFPSKEATGFALSNVRGRS